ncbi:MAG: hypothetical protein KGH64_05020 [Candidatus Micrarchaeota archaeon]|nr:hypothetical protein [Candidatus Micrarchaeota archaeon]MDE1834674.1 hypothetical protein [Candidatus Micrarchaeota archaeon]MDE1859576.1 hypothetical protein [Candidatus Micrarchaeota archaeon]
MELKKTILLVTLLLFIYNALFTYIITQLTHGTGQLIFLVLLALDYIIIFYFILQIAHEMKFMKVKSRK